MAGQSLQVYSRVHAAEDCLHFDSFNLTFSVNLTPSLISADAFSVQL